MFGVSRVLSVTIGGSSTKASLGGVWGDTVDVTHIGPPGGELLATHPAGKAGATTPSKFSLKALPAHGVPVGTGEAVEVAVAVAVGVPGVGVWFVQPIIAKTWSGAVGSMLQVVALRPQTLQAVAKPPPGFCQAAPELLVTVRSSHPHCPPAPKSILA